MPDVNLIVAKGKGRPRVVGVPTPLIVIRAISVSEAVTVDAEAAQGGLAAPGLFAPGLVGGSTPIVRV